MKFFLILYEIIKKYRSNQLIKSCLICKTYVLLFFHRYNFFMKSVHKRFREIDFTKKNAINLAHVFLRRRCVEKRCIDTSIIFEKMGEWVNNNSVVLTWYFWTKKLLQFADRPFQNEKPSNLTRKEKLNLSTSISKI